MSAVLPGWQQSTTNEESDFSRNSSFCSKIRIARGMPSPSDATVYSPSDLRAVAEARIAVFKNGGVLLLGSGFENLCGLNYPDWKGLAFTMCPRCENDRLIKDWTTEFVLRARYELGDVDYKSKIGDQFKARNDFNPENAAFFGISLQYIKLIVSLNYSETILKILSKFSVKYKVIEREFINSIISSEIMNSDVTYVIFLHGRVNDRSSVIFDTWDYNIIVDEDTIYQTFLESVLSQKTLISIGCSWTDGPLKNVAARVRRKNGYAGQTHIMFEIAERFCDSKEIAVSEWKNAMTLAYGLRPIVTPKAQLKEAIGGLLTEKFPPQIDGCLSEIADYLDDAGDFESSAQIEFLKQGQPDGNIVDKVKQNTQTVADAIKRALEKGSVSFETASRIERHLRHHFFLYDPVCGKEKRSNLWNKIKDKRPECELDQRVWFDHLVGGIEMNTERGYTDSSKLNEHFKARVNLARSVWQNGVDCHNLPDKLLDVGWEMLAAKVWSDRLSEQAKSAKTGASERSALIVAEAERISGISRMCGATRRQFKADIIGAVWNPDQRAARHRLLNVYHSNTLNHGLEVGLHSGLLLALFASDIAQGLDRNSKADFIKEWFIEQAQELGIAKIDDVNLVNAAQLNYWSNFMPNRVTEKFCVLYG